MSEVVNIRMANGDIEPMEVCGRAPKIDGDRVVIARDDQFQCYAARLRNNGWHLIPTPIKLYDVL